MIRSAYVSPENILSSSRRANSRVLNRTMAEGTPQSPSFRLHANVGLNTGLTTSSIKPIGVDAPTSNHSDVIFRHNAAYLDMDNLDDSFVTPAKDLKSATPIPRGQSVVRQLSSNFNLQQSLRSQVDDLAQQFAKISGDLLQQQSEQHLAYEKKLSEQAQAHSAQIRQQQAQLQAVENCSASVEQLLQQSLKQQADSQLLLQKLLQQNQRCRNCCNTRRHVTCCKGNGCLQYQHRSPTSRSTMVQQHSCYPNSMAILEIKLHFS
jgi:hypothetical protein